MPISVRKIPLQPITIMLLRRMEQFAEKSLRLINKVRGIKVKEKAELIIMKP